MDQVDLLVQILLDADARIDERDDAAMYLGEYNDDRALNALISIVTDPNSEQYIKDACGESIARIWVQRDYFNPNLYRKMASISQREIYDYIAGKKPEWITKYNLK